MGTEKRSIKELSRTEKTKKLDDIKAEHYNYVLERQKENNCNTSTLDLHFTIEFLMDKIVTLGERCETLRKACNTIK